MRVAIARKPGTARVARPAKTIRRDGRYGLLLAGMVWFQIAYMVVDLHLQAPGDQGSMGPNLIYRSYKLILLAIGIAVMGSRMTVSRAVLKDLNRFFIGFLGLAVASVLWSIDPPVTAARLVALLSMVAVCFAFGVGAWHPRRFQSVVRAPLTLVLLASLIVGLFDPTMVKEVGNTISLKNAWCGLTPQKNEFGEVSSFTVILWMHAWVTREVPAYRALFGLGIGAVCLVLSRSSTSLLCTAFAVMFVLILLQSWSAPATRRYMPYIVAAFATMCTLYGLAVMDVVPGIEKLLLEPVMRLTGKSLTFSGRTEIWQIIAQNIARHPYLGSGYGAYWGAGPVPSSPSFEFVQVMWGFWPTESHNGYYEIRNDLGIVGLMVLIGYILFYIRQSVSLFRIDRAQSVLFLALLFQQTLENLSESTWLDINNFCFTVMTAATFLMARALVEHERGTYGRAAGA